VTPTCSDLGSGNATVTIPSAPAPFVYDSTAGHIGITSASPHGGSAKTSLFATSYAASPYTITQLTCWLILSRLQPPEAYPLRLLEPLPSGGWSWCSWLSCHLTVSTRHRGHNFQILLPLRPVHWFPLRTFCGLLCPHELGHEQTRFQTPIPIESGTIANGNWYLWFFLTDTSGNTYAIPTLVTCYRFVGSVMSVLLLKSPGNTPLNVQPGVHSCPAAAAGVVRRQFTCSRLQRFASFGHRRPGWLVGRRFARKCAIVRNTCRGFYLAGATLSSAESGPAMTLGTTAPMVSGAWGNWHDVSPPHVRVGRWHRFDGD